MAIQMRRGNAVDFNPAKMQPGEWAVSQDDQKIYMCFAQGVVREMGTASSMDEYIEQAEAWARGTKNGEPVSDVDPQYHNNSLYYAGDAQISAGNSSTQALKSEGYAVGTQNGTEVQSGVYYENNAKYYSGVAEEAWNNVDDALDRVNPTMSMDFTTGILSYDGSFFEFTLDKTTGHLIWGVSE